MICERCEKNLPWIVHNPLQNIVSPFRYEEKIAEFITQLKFNKKLIFVPVLANYLINQLQGTQLPEVIVPVPLHKKRLKERGFNQALEISKPISRHFNIPINIGICHRLRATLPQTKLSATKRKENVKKAFILNHKPHFKHIAILDDVVTTGATVEQIAFLFRKHGVKHIDVWCCARA